MSTLQGGAVQHTGPGEWRTIERDCSSVPVPTSMRKGAETKDLAISDSDLIKRQMILEKFPSGANC